MKQGPDKTYKVLDWISGDVNINIDIRGFLYKSFGAHKKQITTSVVDKINNTERVARTLLLRQNDNDLLKRVKGKKE